MDNERKPEENKITVEKTVKTHSKECSYQKNETRRSGYNIEVW